jgi:hypothetical protein
MKKRTPGPWILLLDMHDGSYSPIGIAYDWDYVEREIKDAERVAAGNISVVVISLPQALAAPDLLEAATDSIDDLVDGSITVLDWEHDDLNNPEFRTEIRSRLKAIASRLRNAIRKATGE